MTTWVLVIFMGVTGWGAGSVTKAYYSSKESCYEALSNMVITNNRKLSGKDSDAKVVTYCKPKIED